MGCSKSKGTTVYGNESSAGAAAIGVTILGTHLGWPAIISIVVVLIAAGAIVTAAYKRTRKNR